MPAAAKPWYGISPSETHKNEILDRFGEPSKSVTKAGKETLVYAGSKAPKGTVQAQFKLNSELIAERIDVYPSVKLTPAAIEKAYGVACDAPETTDPCYVKKETPTKRLYFVYLKLGLAVFFDDDDRYVKLITFLPGQ